MSFSNHKPNTVSAILATRFKLRYWTPANGWSTIDKLDEQKVQEIGENIKCAPLIGVYVTEVAGAMCFCLNTMKFGQDGRRPPRTREEEEEGWVRIPIYSAFCGTEHGVRSFIRLLAFALDTSGIGKEELGRRLDISPVRQYDILLYSEVSKIYAQHFLAHVDNEHKSILAGRDTKSPASKHQGSQHPSMYFRSPSPSWDVGPQEHTPGQPVSRPLSGLAPSHLLFSTQSYSEGTTIQASPSRGLLSQGGRPGFSYSLSMPYGNSFADVDSPDFTKALRTFAQPPTALRNSFEEREVQELTSHASPNAIRVGDSFLPDINKSQASSSKPATLGELVSNYSTPVPVSREIRSSDVPETHQGTGMMQADISSDFGLGKHNIQDTTLSGDLANVNGLPWNSFEFTRKWLPQEWHEGAPLQNNGGRLVARRSKSHAQYPSCSLSSTSLEGFRKSSILENAIYSPQNTEKTAGADCSFKPFISRELYTRQGEGIPGQCLDLWSDEIDEITKIERMEHQRSNSMLECAPVTDTRPGTSSTDLLSAAKDAGGPRCSLRKFASRRDLSHYSALADVPGFVKPPEGPPSGRPQFKRQETTAW